MNKPEKVEDVSEYVVEDPKFNLERVYIEESLQMKGFTLITLKKLPKDRGMKLMSMASQYAYGKLADLEAREKLFFGLRDLTENQ